MTAGSTGAPGIDDAPTGCGEVDAELVLAIGRARVWLRRRLLAQRVPSDLADELVQDTLLWLWARREKWNDADHMRAAATIYSRNRLVDHLRSAGARRLDLRAEFADDCLGAGRDVADVVAENLVFAGVIAALRQLPAGDARLLAELVDGASYDELAAQWGVAAGTVRVRAHRARERFKRIYKPTQGLALLVAFPRTVRRLLANPTSVGARIVMTSAALTLAAPLVTAPVRVRPMQTPAVFAVGDAPRARSIGKIALAAPPSADRHQAAHQTHAKVTARTHSPAPSPDTCVGDRLVCLGEPQPSGSPAPPGTRMGDWVCSAPAGQCVSQQLIGVCQYADHAPDQVARCDRYSDPEVIDPPPPPGASPSPSTAPTTMPPRL